MRFGKDNGGKDNEGGLYLNLFKSLLFSFTDSFSVLTHILSTKFIRFLMRISKFQFTLPLYLYINRPYKICKLQVVSTGSLS